jgi:hypothetical protein
METFQTESPPVLPDVGVGVDVEGSGKMENNIPHTHSIDVCDAPQMISNVEALKQKLSLSKLLVCCSFIPFRLFSFPYSHPHPSRSPSKIGFE